MKRSAHEVTVEAQLQQGADGRPPRRCVWRLEQEGEAELSADKLLHGRIDERPSEKSGQTLHDGPD